MAAPELVFQQGVKMGWLLYERYPRVIGWLLRYLPIATQEEYKDMLKADKMSERVVFMNPKGGTAFLPVVSIVPQTKTEEINFVGDGGTDSYDPQTLPFPPVNPEDFPQIKRYFGLLHGLTTSPEYMFEDGDRSSSPTKFHDKVTLNRGIQRHPGDEQRTQFGAPQKVYNALTQYVESRSSIDRVIVSATVRADNGEKTLIYADLLMSVLREYSLWFHMNGLMNPVFSMGTLQVDSIGPTTGGDPNFMREIQMSFLHEDMFHSVRPVIAKFLIDMNMVTVRKDGTEDLTQVASIETEGDSVSPVPPPFDLNDG